MAAEFMCSWLENETIVQAVKKRKVVVEIEIKVNIFLVLFKEEEYRR